MRLAATVVNVVDGDTVDVTVTSTVRVRLADIDAPERGTEPGDAATAYLKALLPVGSAVTIDPKSEDPHGRVVAWVALDVNERLVVDGHARRWT